MEEGRKEWEGESGGFVLRCLLFIVASFPLPFWWGCDMLFFFFLLISASFSLPMN